jgi:glycosyltransferase involved in cell wall biosynthesis
LSSTLQVKPTELLIFRPTLGQGGADRVTVTLLQKLDRARFNTSLVLMRREGSLVGEVPPGVNVCSLDARSLWTAWLPLLRVVRERRPEVFFSTSSGANITAILAHALTRQKGRLVLSERNVLLHGAVSVKKKFILLLKRMLYRRADIITSVSQGVKDDLVAKLGIAPERISVVYNPVVTDGLSLMADETVEHPWFGEDVPIILAVGRLVLEKDHETLIEAFRAVRDGRRARLVILGDGPLRGKLEALVKARGLKADVWFAGFDKNPFRYMSKCTVFVLSSRQEGLPGVLIQAMSCGAPVISTDCPAGPSEIIEPGVDGLLVPVGDVSALAGKIEYLLDHPEVRRRMGESAKLASCRFGVKEVVEKYVRALVDYNNRGRG